MKRVFFFLSNQIRQGSDSSRSWGTGQYCVYEVVDKYYSLHLLFLPMDELFPNTEIDKDPTGIFGLKPSVSVDSMLMSYPQQLLPRRGLAEDKFHYSFRLPSLPTAICTAPEWHLISPTTKKVIGRLTMSMTSCDAMHARSRKPAQRSLSHLLLNPKLQAPFPYWQLIFLF